MNSDSFSQVKLQVALSPCLQMIIKPVLCWPWLWTMFTLTTSYWVSPDSVDHHSCYSDETRIFNLIRIILLSLFWLKSMCQLIIQWHNNSGADQSPVLNNQWSEVISIMQHPYPGWVKIIVTALISAICVGGIVAAVCVAVLTKNEETRKCF